MNDTKAILTNVRFSYCHVFKPYAFEKGDEERYSVTVIIPKDDAENLDKIDAAIDAAVNSGKHVLGKKWRDPLRDGDEERAEDENFADCYFLNASSKRKPGLVDENLDPILDANEFYSGCYGNVSLNFASYDNKSKGVGCYLNNIQKTADGEALGGVAASPEEDFKEVTPKRGRSRRSDDERPRGRSRRGEAEDEEEEERPRRRRR